MSKTEVQAGTVLASTEELSLVLRQLRKASGLSQRELARKAQTKPSVICRLENPAYRGHSLEMLKRIGAALGVEVAVQFASHEPQPSNPTDMRGAWLEKHPRGGQA